MPRAADPPTSLSTPTLSHQSSPAHQTSSLIQHARNSIRKLFQCVATRTLLEFPLSRSSPPEPACCSAKRDGSQPHTGAGLHQLLHVPSDQPSRGVSRLIPRCGQGSLENPDRRGRHTAHRSTSPARTSGYSGPDHGSFQSSTSFSFRYTGRSAHRQVLQHSLPPERVGHRAPLLPHTLLIEHTEIDQDAFECLAAFVEVLSIVMSPQAQPKLKWSDYARRPSDSALSSRKSPPGGRASKIKHCT